jgi:hypothetical protein
VNAGPGCSAGLYRDYIDVFQIVCARDESIETGRLARYRLSLNERENHVGVLTARLTGVIYSGPGDDTANAEDQPRTAIYGGRVTTAS